MSFSGAQQQGFLRYNPSKNPNTVYANRAPTTADVSQKDGSFWIDQTNAVAYVKINSSAGVANWVTCGSVAVPVTVAQGGTGQVSLTSGSLLAGNGTGAVSLVSRDEFIRYADVSIAATAVKTLRATPVELVAAPGAGKALYFQGCVLKLDYGSEVFTETDDNLAVKVTDGSGFAVSQAIECTDFIDAAADTYTNGEPAINAIVAAADLENAPLVLHNTGDGEFGGNASDDSVLIVRTFYRVVEI